MNRLMLCSGIFRREGWKTLDCNPVHHPDFVAKIPPLPQAVKALQWDEIEWIHGISTGIERWQVPDLLEQIRLSLRATPAGKLVLEQPDRDKCDRPEWMFGDPSLCDPNHMNRWAYTPTDLTLLLRQAGFSRVDVLPARHHVPARDFRVEAYR